MTESSHVSDHSCPGSASAHPSAVTLRNDPSHQAPPLRQIRRIRNGHASPCNMKAMFRYRLDPSRPGRANGPSLISPGGAPGVNRRSSQVYSRRRVADRFRSSRAHVPVRPTTRPDALYSGLTRR